jgi:hypothetical protein
MKWKLAECEHTEIEEARLFLTKICIPGNPFRFADPQVSTSTLLW